jgi:phosphoribosyl 1,2-cyclic phosphate phosphodiesterase
MNRMQFEFLGTGGAIATPVPGLTDPTNVKARTLGVPYSRYGPCLFVHGPDLLIDTPEEARLALDRANIAHVPHCIYSHWHPDHVLGRRIFELNRDWGTWPDHPFCSQVYLPEQVAVDARVHQGLYETLSFLQSKGLLKLHEMRDGESLNLNGVRITPFRLAQRYAYGFMLLEGDTRVLVVPDELYAWQPPAFTYRVDLAILPTGVFEENLRAGNRRIPAGHPIFESEATFAQTLAMVEQMQPRRVIFTHIEAIDMLDHDELQALGHELTQSGRYGEVTFAWDTLKVSI